MTNAKTPAGGGGAPTEQPAASWLSTRSGRIVAIGIVAVIALGLGVVAFTQFAPTSGLLASPTSSPSTPSGGVGSPSAAPSGQPPTDGPVVPDVTPIDFEQPGIITAGLTAQIAAVEAVDGIAQGPGEVAGPSLRVTVTITNSTSSETSLRTAIVSCYFGPDRTPAQELREPGGRPLPASIAPNKAIDGLYIFTVPEDQRGDVTIMVDYSVDVVPLVFQGDVAELMAR